MEEESGIYILPNSSHFPVPREVLWFSSNKFLALNLKFSTFRILMDPKSPPLLLSLLQPTTLNEICNLIYPSSDKIYALDLIFDPFSYPWSISFTEGCLPSSFAHITVYPVFKKPLFSSNFCRISILNFISKS